MEAGATVGVVEAPGAMGALAEEQRAYRFCAPKKIAASFSYL